MTAVGLAPGEPHGAEPLPSLPPGTIRPLWHLVWPVLAEQVLAMLVGFSDTLLAGHYLGRSHLAAMALVSYALWALPSLFTIAAIGATAMTARFVGARDAAAANRVANQALVLGAALALVTMGVAFLASLWLSSLGSVESALVARYLQFLVPIVPCMMIETVAIASLRGAGDMVTGLVAMALVNVTNIAVAWTLLLGVGPLAPLGWDSLAIGTACGYTVGGLLPLVLLCRGRAGLRLQLALLRPDWSLIRRIVRVGLPAGVDALSVITCQLLFVSMINRLGDLAMAAHGVAIRIESLAYLPGSAFQVAAATLAGQHLGARDHRQATRSVLTACAAAISVMSMSGLILYFGADYLVRLFVGAHQPEVAEASAPLLRIVSCAMLPMAVLMVLTGALRGAGDTRWPLVVTFIGFLSVRMPTAYLLTSVWSWGVQGAWYAMAADLTVRAVLVTSRFLHGGWKHTEV